MAHLRDTASQPPRNRAKSAQKSKKPFRTEIPFDNNRLLTDLLGEFDAHLSMIEDKLGVEAVAHGNVVVVRGSETGCAIAQDVLQSLYERLKAGHSITLGDIDGAIRHAQTGISLDGDNHDKAGAGQLRTRKKFISARTPMQSAYIEALKSREMIFATGPAGTGKTYLAVAHAAARLERGDVERLILSRPAVEAGERLGFLPGDLKEKVDPYLRPLYDALYDVLPAEKVERELESGVIEIAPLAFMRGRTLSHAAIILDKRRIAPLCR